MIALSDQDLDRLLRVIRNGTRSLKDYEPPVCCQAADIHSDQARERFITLLDKYLAKKEGNNAPHI